MTIGFPTLGELIKYVFNATGIIPSKREHYHQLNSTEKKSLQKALARLAREEGDINSNISELINTLFDITFSGVKNEKLMMVMSEIAFDIFDVYRNVITSDGSYLSKEETIRWFLSTYIIPRLAISVNKHIFRLNIKSEHLLFPDDSYWFLPTIENTKISWPLTKAMKWLYELSGENQTQFHYFGKSTDTECFIKKNNLENAQNWFTGHHIPSWEGLQQNITQALSALSASHPWIMNKKENILIVLFVARLSTYVTKEIYEIYGSEYLTELIEQYQKHTRWLSVSTLKLHQIVDDVIKKTGCPPPFVDNLYFDCAEKFWKDKADMQTDATYCIESKFRLKKYKLSTEDKELLTKQYGESIVGPIVEFLDRQENLRTKIPVGFEECITLFLSLQRSPSNEGVSAYRKTLGHYNLSETLAWTTPWLQAQISHQNENYSEMYQFIKVAYQTAKYSAGQNQNRLVNQYLYACAKNNKWREFKKGVHWAQYIGIEVRLLTNNEPTEENLRGVFNFMKNYHVL